RCCLRVGWSGLCCTPRIGRLGSSWRRLSVATPRRTPTTEEPDKTTFAEDIKTALVRLGGEGSLAEIYREIERIRPVHLLTRTWQASVRGCLERSSADSASFAGHDILRSSGGIGSARWLRAHS